jgi:hypothetical protein
MSYLNYKYFDEAKLILTNYISRLSIFSPYWLVGLENRITFFNRLFEPQSEFKVSWAEWPHFDVFYFLKLFLIIFILLFFHIICMFLIFNLKNLDIPSTFFFWQTRYSIRLTTNCWWVEVFLQSAIL